jgi:hypothetical protein
MALQAALGIVCCIDLDKWWLVNRYTESVREDAAGSGSDECRMDE